MTQTSPNTYSQQWFASFHLPIDHARTDREVDFICAVAPLPDFRTIADICCGVGRHARALSERGYSVTGVDRDSTMIVKGRELGAGPHYIQADLREYQPDYAAYDVVIVMGQSFGHFDAATNQMVLRRLTSGIRQGGRLILDLWNPDFFVSHQGEHNFVLANGIIRETKRVESDRLFVHLEYPNGEREDFEWELFTPARLQAVATPLGLTLIACYTDFDRSRALCGSKPRLEIVLERQ